MGVLKDIVLLEVCIRLRGRVSELHNLCKEVNCPMLYFYVHIYFMYVRDVYT